MPSLLPLGWAGFLTEIPEHFRPFKVEGNYKRGVIGLSDRDRPRLEILWATAGSGFIDGERLALKHLKRIIPKSVRSNFENRVKRVANPSFSPLLVFNNDETGIEHCVGYAPATRRAFEVAYRLNRSSEDDLFNSRILPNLHDQPLNNPHKWAVFSTNFTSPPGFTYHSSTLNLGDMSIRLVNNARWPVSSITMREIYPAKLALSRKPLEEWLADIEKQGRHTYLGRYHKMFRCGGIIAESVDTPVGKGLSIDLRLRTMLFSLFWRIPPAARMRLIHDELHDRLVCITIAAAPNRFNELYSSLIDGLYWTSPAKPSE